MRFSFDSSSHALYDLALHKVNQWKGGGEWNALFVEPCDLAQSLPIERSVLLYQVRYSLLPKPWTYP